MKCPVVEVTITLAVIFSTVFMLVMIMMMTTFESIVNTICKSFNQFTETIHKNSKQVKEDEERIGGNENKNNSGGFFRERILLGKLFKKYKKERKDDK